MLAEPRQHQWPLSSLRKQLVKKSLVGQKRFGLLSDKWSSSWELLGQTCWVCDLSFSNHQSWYFNLKYIYCVILFICFWLLWVFVAMCGLFSTCSKQGY